MTKASTHATSSMRTHWWNTSCDPGVRNGASALPRRRAPCIDAARHSSARTTRVPGRSRDRGGTMTRPKVARARGCPWLPFLAPRDRILRLARAVGAAAERTQLLGEQHRLVAVGPAQEDALLAQQLDADRLLGGGSRGRRLVGVGAGIAGACTADRAVGQDAVLPLAPLDTECVAPHLPQTRDPPVPPHPIPPPR